MSWRIRFVLPNLPRPNAVAFVSVILVIDVPRPVPNPARYLYLITAAVLVDNSRCICKMAVTRKLCVLVSLTALHLLVSPLLLLNNCYILNCPSLEYGGGNITILMWLILWGGPMILLVYLITMWIRNMAFIFCG